MYQLSSIHTSWAAMDRAATLNIISGALQIQEYAILLMSLFLQILLQI